MQWRENEQAFSFKFTPAFVDSGRRKEGERVTAMGGAYLLYAAGGTARHRHLRKLLVDACSPMLEPLSFALDNGDESFRIPCTIEMLQSIERAAEKVTNQPKAPQILDGDSVLLIGTIKPASFDPLVLGKKVDVWLQGPGFNYGETRGPPQREPSAA